MCSIRNWLYQYGSLVLLIPFTVMGVAPGLLLLVSRLTVGTRALTGLVFYANIVEVHCTIFLSVLLQPNLAAAMCTAPCRWTHPRPPVPPFLLTQKFFCAVRSMTLSTVYYRVLKQFYLCTFIWKLSTWHNFSVHAFPGHPSTTARWVRPGNRWYTLILHEWSKSVCHRWWTDCMAMTHHWIERRL